MGSERTARDGQPAGGLALLLVEEERLDQLLTAARARGEVLVTQARAEAGRLRTSLDDELAAARLDSERRAVAELARRRIELAATTAAAIERLEGLADTEVDRIAEWLVAQVVGQDRSS